MAATQKAHILLVDDERDFLEPIIEWLELKGYRVSTCGSGNDAAAWAQRETPDIVFMDINMKGGDGLTTLPRIKALHPRVPVIMLTSSYDHKYFFDKANKLGAAGFFPKQSSLEELLSIIETMLRIQPKPKNPLS